MIKYYKFSYDFFKYFSSLNLKYLKLTKMDITRFAIKLHILLMLMIKKRSPINLQYNFNPLGDVGSWKDNSKSVYNGGWEWGIAAILITKLNIYLE